MKPSGKESGLAGVLSVATHREVFQSYSLKRAAHSSNQAQQHGHARLLIGRSGRVVPSPHIRGATSHRTTEFIPSLRAKMLRHSPALELFLIERAMPDADRGFCH